MKKKLLILLGIVFVFVMSETSYHAIFPKDGMGAIPHESRVWVWRKAIFNDGRVVAPKAPGSFGITFGGDGRFRLRTDCNSVSGTYVTADPVIEFTNIISTKKFCQDSQEMEFIRLISDSTTYHFSEDGKLILGLAFDSGSVVFE